MELSSQIETRKPIVRNELSLATAPFFTVRFGTSVPRSKSGSLYSLFVLELPLSDQKEKADLSQFVPEQILEKQATIRFGSRLANQREDAKTEIGFTIPYGSQRHYSIIHLPIRIRNPEWKSWLQVG